MMEAEGWKARKEGFSIFLICRVLGLFLRRMPYIFSKREKRSGGHEKGNSGNLLQAFCGGQGEGGRGKRKHPKPACAFAGIGTKAGLGGL